MIVTARDIYRLLARNAFPVLVAIGLGLGAPSLWLFGLLQMEPPNGSQHTTH